MNLDKLTYSIGQASEIIDAPQSTICYWETVIDILNPEKTAGGSRRYTKGDINILLKLKTLLYDEGLTIKGANKYFSTWEPEDEKAHEEMTAHKNKISTKENKRLLQKIKNELIEIRDLLNSNRD